jgi:hypothetical protein
VVQWVISPGPNTQNCGFGREIHDLMASREGLTEQRVNISKSVI